VASLKPDFVYDLNDFHLLRQFSYAGEGWGLATGGHEVFYERRNGGESAYSIPQRLQKNAVSPFTTDILRLTS